MEHKNRWTGERLAQAVQVCSGCHRNFLDTPSGDAHRKNFTCLIPKKTKFSSFVNRFGSVVYALKGTNTPQGYTVSNMSVGSGLQTSK